MREGRFPQSRRIGKVAMDRLENEVEDWIRDRAIAVKPSESNKSRYVNFPGYWKAIREGF
jgi:hypothetical protein